MKKTYLLDTNVLSGLLAKDPLYTRGVQAYVDGNWAISSITEFELFLYKEKIGLPSNLFHDFLSSFIVYPLDSAVLLIAATAIVQHVPLITADKGMQKYTHAKVILLK